MNYFEYYGLQQDPFALGPAGRFYYNSAPHAAALLKATQVVEGDGGATAIVGPHGSGKTSLALRLIEQLSPDAFQAVWVGVDHGGADAAWLLRTVARQIGTDATSESGLSGAVAARLDALLDAGRTPVAIVDDADRLADAAAWRTLADLCGGARPRLKLVLLASPAFAARLGELPAPLSGVPVTNLAALTRDAVVRYVRHRLRLAGGARPIFVEEALTAVHDHTHGSPRAINRLCDRLLLEGMLAARDQVTRDAVDLCANDLGDDAGAIPAADAPAPRTAAAPAATADVVAVADEFAVGGDVAAEFMADAAAGFHEESDAGLVDAVEADAAAAADPAEPEVTGDASGELDFAIEDGDNLEALIEEMEGRDEAAGAGDAAQDLGGVGDLVAGLSEEVAGGEVDLGSLVAEDDAEPSPAVAAAGEGDSDLDDLDAALRAFSSEDEGSTPVAAAPAAADDDGGDVDLDALMGELDAGAAPAGGDQDVDSLLNDLEAAEAPPPAPPPAPAKPAAAAKPAARPAPAAAKPAPAAAKAAAAKPAPAAPAASAESDIDALLGELGGTPAAAPAAAEDDEIDRLLNDLNDEDDAPRAPAKAKAKPADDLDDLLNQIEALRDG